MLKIFYKSDQTLKSKKIISGNSSNPYEGIKSSDVLWADCKNPSLDDLNFLQTSYSVKLATKVKTSLEGSARNYTDKNGLHLHLYFLNKKQQGFGLTSVSFLLKNNVLFSLREKDAPVLRLLSMKLKSGLIYESLQTSGEELLLKILEENVDFFADKLEDLYSELNTASDRILQNTDQDMNFVLNIITRIEDANSKIRLCLLDAQRGLSFLQRNCNSNLLESQANKLKIQEISRDIDSLISHTNFVFEKFNFLLNSAQGFININQNKIIKIFSIMSLMFMPPTLIASIYGMNFEFMPELSAKYAYPLALFFMIISAYLPYKMFKRKGWL